MDLITIIEIIKRKENAREKMKFKEIENIDEFCEKYGIRKHGGIRTSEKFPFIFLIYNKCSKYRDQLVANNDGIISKVNYIAVPNEEENNNLKNHTYLRGVYHSVFLLQHTPRTYRCLGEYEVKKTNMNVYGKIESFDLQLVGKNGLDDEIVYFVEKNKPIKLSKLTDRSDVIEGLYPEEEFITYDGTIKNIHEGMYLDSDFRIINLEGIIDTKSVYQQGDIISLNFVMREGSTMPERKVAHHLYLLNETNKEIQEKYLSSTDEAVFVKEIKEAFLYTINVGCGLTNFLVKKYEHDVSVWAIDWGSGRGYTPEAKQHISKCIDEIKNTFFAGHDFTLERLFISHADSDHYNRVDADFINSNTEVWVNGYNLTAGNFLNKLNQIKNKGAKFKHPICASSTSEINILHPIWPIVFGAPKYIGPGVYVAQKKNNVSPIIKIMINSRSIIFVGDIMPYDDSGNTKPGGWEWYNNIAHPKNLQCDIYFHSHHGSDNGFITNVPNAGDCEYDIITSSLDFLSTRDNAYPGNIPSTTIQGRTEYVNIKSTQLKPNELAYYKTDILTLTSNPIFE